MHDEDSARGELNDFEKQLAALAPRCVIDRDRLMFAAGQRSTRRLRWTNRALSVASLALVCAVGALVVERGAVDVQRSPRIAGPVTSKPVPIEAPIPRAEKLFAVADGPTNLRLRRAFDRGVANEDARRPKPDDELPWTQGDERWETPRALLRQYLDQAAGRL